MIEQLKSKKLAKLTRMEISIAEVLRLRQPLSQKVVFDPTFDLWLDLCDDFDKLLKAGNPRFDEDAFYNHTFGDTDVG